MIVVTKILGLVECFDVLLCWALIDTSLRCQTGISEFLFIKYNISLS